MEFPGPASKEDPVTRGERMAQRRTLEGRAAGKRRSSQHQSPGDSALGEEGRGAGA